MKVINESDSFKGHAESADLVPDAMINCDINRCATQPQGSAKCQRGPRITRASEKMYEYNILELSSEQKQQF